MFYRCLLFMFLLLPYVFPFRMNCSQTDMAKTKSQLSKVMSIALSCSQTRSFIATVKSTTQLTFPSKDCEAAVRRLISNVFTARQYLCRSFSARKRYQLHVIANSTVFSCVGRATETKLQVWCVPHIAKEQFRFLMFTKIALSTENLCTHPINNTSNQIVYNTDSA